MTTYWFVHNLVSGSITLAISILALLSALNVIPAPADVWIVVLIINFIVQGFWLFIHADIMKSYHSILTKHMPNFFHIILYGEVINSAAMVAIAIIVNASDGQNGRFAEYLFIYPMIEMVIHLNYLFSGGFH